MISLNASVKAAAWTNAILTTKITRNLTSATAPPTVAKKDTKKSPHSAITLPNSRFTPEYSRFEDKRVLKETGVLLPHTPIGLFNITSDRMANLLLLITFVAFFTATAASLEPPARLLQSTKPNPLHGAKEKLSHLRFFLHDTLSGSKPTAVTVARGPKTNESASLFGMINVIDDPLTVGPDVSSRLLGRAQGLYASAAQDTLGLMMAMNFIFVEGKYNGSTLAVLGRNQVFTPVREMPIIGGSGLFRFARGYVLDSTYSLNNNTGDAVLEYNCFVIHY